MLPTSLLSALWFTSAPAASTGTLVGAIGYFDGEPAGGVPILLDGEPAGTTEADGSFRLSLRPGRWLVDFHTEAGRLVGLEMTHGVNSSSGTQGSLLIYGHGLQTADWRLPNSRQTGSGAGRPGLGPEFAAFPTGQVHGQVTDPNGQPLADVQVYSAQHMSEAHTNEHGEYTLTLPAHRHDLTLRQDGRETVRIRGLQVTEDQSTAVDVALHTLQPGELALRLKPPPPAKPTPPARAEPPFDAETWSVAVDWCTYEVILSQPATIATVGLGRPGDEGQPCLHRYSMLRGDRLPSLCGREAKPPAHLTPVPKTESPRIQSGCTSYNMAPYGLTGRGMQPQLRCRVTLDGQVLRSDEAGDHFDRLYSVDFHHWLVEPPVGMPVLVLAPTSTSADRPAYEDFVPVYGHYQKPGELRPQPAYCEAP